MTTTAWAERFSVAGRVALVTGGSKGLGKAFARGLAEAGADVVIASRSADELRDALDEIIEGTPSRGATVVADLARRGEADRLATEAIDAFGRIDILVNNAGTNHLAAIDEIADEQWDRVLELNVTAAMALSRAVVPGMRERGWGRIVHVSSIMGLVSRERRNLYSATKSALLGLARASAIDVGEAGITVNCLAPGYFLTPMTEAVVPVPDRAALAARTAVGRWGDLDELVGPLLLLCSDAGSFITGSALVVDGGYTAR
ncbi:MAG: SDR family NAD(P)-dependent oxidoreductase [Ilumatobacteraceae bacterium]